MRGLSDFLESRRYAAMAGKQGSRGACARGGLPAAGGDGSCHPHPCFPAMAAVFLWLGGKIRNISFLLM